MSRLMLLCPPLLRHHTVLFLKLGGRFTHSERPRHRELSPTESVVGIVVFFTTFFIPAAYVLTNLNYFRRE
ncbi:cytochrome c oxidase subunit 8C, mitochondrial [Peromyscus eremicus]|uniref:cytochrome c oxidase subunit 8C, mitochondrial n=1 Tax=Peromyscus eremicus TaxID=42410 RepID=UPI0027DD0513|nr:cytochrome c oxidase subunit 8C, mitochondrial [Peromyscus eremicus]